MASSDSKKVKSFNKYYKDYLAAPRHSTEETQALEGMAAKAITNEQLTLVARKALYGSEIEKQAILKLANKAKNMTTLIEVAKMSAADSELRNTIEEMMVERAKTRSDWHKIYCYAECGSKLEGLAYNKYHSMK